MNPRSSSAKKPAEQVVKDIRRATRRHFSAEDKIRIVLDRQAGATGAALGVGALLATGSLGAFIDNLLWAKNNYSEANRMAYGEVIGGYPALFDGASGAGDWIIRVMIVIGLTLPVWLPPLCGLLVLKNRDRNLIYFCVCGL